MILLHGKCGRKARFAARLYQQRFPDDRHPSHKTILKKLLRETSCMTSLPRSGRRDKVVKKVQPEDVLSYGFTYQNSNTRKISENCRLSKSCVWKILNELSAIPYHSCQHLIRHYWTGRPRDVMHGVTLS